MEYVITVLALLVFGYFLYSRIKKSRKQVHGGISGGGGSDIKPPSQVEQ